MQMLLAAGGHSFILVQLAAQPREVQSLYWPDDGCGWVLACLGGVWGGPETGVSLLVCGVSS